jgi:membrane-associated phospholipid phosphatase
MVGSKSTTNAGEPDEQRITHTNRLRNPRKLTCCTPARAPHRPRVDTRLAQTMLRLPSLVVSWLVANIGAALVAALMIGLGLLVTKVVLANTAIAAADDRFPEWLAHHRTTFWTQWSYVGSLLGDRPVLVPLVGVTAAVLVLSHRWRMASFVVQAGLAEVLAYGVTVAVVHRDRPHVERLGHYNRSTASPPGTPPQRLRCAWRSALLLTAHYTGRAARITIWAVAVAVAVALDVTLARIYRGQHHPSDVAAGALLGVAALVALFAARTARAVAELRAEVSR